MNQILIIVVVISLTILLTVWITKWTQSDKKEEKEEKSEKSEKKETFTNNQCNSAKQGSYYLQQTKNNQLKLKIDDLTPETKRAEIEESLRGRVSEKSEPYRLDSKLTEPFRGDEENYNPYDPAIMRKEENITFESFDPIMTRKEENITFDDNASIVHELQNSYEDFTENVQNSEVKEKVKEKELETDSVKFQDYAMSVTILLAVLLLWYLLTRK